VKLPLIFSLWFRLNQFGNRNPEMHRLAVPDDFEGAAVCFYHLADPGAAQPFAGAVVALPAEGEKRFCVDIPRERKAVIGVVNKNIFDVFPDLEQQVVPVPSRVAGSVGLGVSDDIVDRFDEGSFVGLIFLATGSLRKSGSFCSSKGFYLLLEKFIYINLFKSSR
jgi:hypothetical protein